MAVEQQQGGIANMIESHPAISIGVLIVVGALIFGKFQQNKATTAATSSNLGGLATDANGNHLVYVPTTSSFTTINTNSNNSSNTTTVNKPPVVTPGPPPVKIPPVTIPPITKPPTHTPAPPPAPKYGLVWGARHSVTSDDTNHGAGALAYIAGQSTAIMHSQQHAPSSVSVSAGDIVKHNAGLRTNSILKLGQSIVLPSYERIS